MTHRETLSAPSPRRRHASRRASSWQGGCRARRARATGAREPRRDGGRAGAFPPAINIPTPGTRSAPLAMCFPAPRASPPRVSPPSRLRSRGIRVRSSPRVFRSRLRENAAPRAFRARGFYPRVATLPWGNAAFKEGRPRSHVRGDDRVASRPGRARAGPSRRAFSLPRSPPRYARETGADRDSRTPFARGGIPSRPLNGLPSRASPRSAHIFSPVLVCPNPRLTDAPIDPPYQPAGPWFRHFPRRRYPRARYRARHRSRAQGARGARGGEGFLRPLRLPQAGASLAARPDRRQINPHTARRTRFEP